MWESNKYRFKRIKFVYTHLSEGRYAKIPFLHKYILKLVPHYIYFRITDNSLFLCVGPTARPWDPEEKCTIWESDFHICANDPNTIKVDVEKCMSLDYRARPVQFKYGM